MSYVLVVEDEDDLRELVVDLLFQAGYRVMAASGGAEALVLMRAATPAFVVMDLMMPQMSGSQLADEMEQDPQLRSIPFCVMTASKFLPSPERAACVIRKPFQPDDLLRTVERHVRPGGP